MPSQVRDLTSSVDVLTGLVKSLVSSLDDLKLQQQQLERSLSEKEETCQKLSVENAQLRQRVADVAASSSDERWRQFPRAHGTAILGSSIVRDIDQNKLVATKCICMPGGHIKDIHTKLDQFPPDNKLHRVVLVVGGNDCDGRPDTPITDILAEYKDLVEGAKSIAATVTVSSVCPRKKSPETSDRIDAINAGLQGLCDDLHVDFVNHTPSFKLQDGTFNDGFLLPDGVHLTKAATNKLVANLRLDLRQGEVTAHADHRKRTVNSDSAAHPPDTPDTLDLSHSFWQIATRKARRHKPHTHALRQSGSQPPSRSARTPSYQQAASQQASRQQAPQTLPRWPRDMPREVMSVGQAPRKIRPTPTHHDGRPHPLINATPTPLMDIPTRPPTSVHQQPYTHNMANRVKSDTSTQCQLCLGSGHTTVTCKSKESQCYNCGHYGHLARACPT